MKNTDAVCLEQGRFDSKQTDQWSVLILGVIIVPHDDSNLGKKKKTIVKLWLKRGFFFTPFSLALLRSSNVFDAKTLFCLCFFVFKHCVKNGFWNWSGKGMWNVLLHTRTLLAWVFVSVAQTRLTALYCIWRSANLSLSLHFALESITLRSWKYYMNMWMLTRNVN